MSEGLVLHILGEATVGDLDVAVAMKEKILWLQILVPREYALWTSCEQIEQGGCVRVENAAKCTTNHSACAQLWAEFMCGR